MQRPQDQFIDEDEEEEVCPLCVEELDLTDKGFRPCPCGYQICQFCYNNIKTTMNGLCPACRRKYEDKNIQYKAVSPEEMAQHKQNQAQQAKRKAQAKQKEAQKREADSLSRKHLAGLRVRQKNLVYVTGLKPKIAGDKLSEALRSHEYFGQYGDIVKVVVSKPKDSTQSPNQPVAIYITFHNKDDATRCINAVDGIKQSDGSKLRAQYGTTKYCSAYLRGDTCTNKNCMFLHEPGEDSESFTRQDLSSLNAYHSQQAQPPQQQLPVAAAVQDLHEQAVVSIAGSPSDGPALPATASWGDQARRASRATASSTNSPLVTNAVAAKVAPKEEQPPPPQESTPEPSTKKSSKSKLRYPYFEDLPRKAFDPKQGFCFSYPPHFTEADIWVVEHLPPLFDPSEGSRRRLLKEKEAEEFRRQQIEPLEQKSDRESSHEEHVDLHPSGSSQLGGEPEENPDRTFAQHGILSHNAIGSNPQAFGLSDDIIGLGSRPSQQQQQQQHQQALLLQQLKMPGSNQPNHARQPSRFFDNASSSKHFPKQSLGNQFSQNQPSQFSLSSVSGPPPGLKTTGTPPVSGGGMFAQGHGFAGFGNRENDKWSRGNSGTDSGKLDLFQTLLPPHASPSPGAQSYPFGGPPSVLYPSGNPQKQKKKGKRYRHANTSSSGGGVVDVADPSILQMRVGNSMSGQAYGANQGQSGGFPSSLHGNSYRGPW